MILTENIIDGEIFKKCLIELWKLNCKCIAKIVSGVLAYPVKNQPILLG